MDMGSSRVVLEEGPVGVGRVSRQPAHSRLREDSVRGTQSADPAMVASPIAKPDRARSGELSEEPWGVAGHPQRRGTDQGDPITGELLGGERRQLMVSAATDRGPADWHRPDRRWMQNDRE